MYKGLVNDFKTTETVGRFEMAQDTQFQATLESIDTAFKAKGYDPFSAQGFVSIAKDSHLLETYTDLLFQDTATESMNQFDNQMVNDPYAAMLPGKLNQLMENTVQDVLESTMGVEMNPIVGFSLPIMKKSFLRCNAKDIMLTEIPKEPIIRVAFERKFMRNHAGDKFYIPDIFYATEDSMGDYDTVMEHSRGEKINDQAYTLPFTNGYADVLVDSGGSVAMRDTISSDFHIAKVVFEIGGVEYEVDSLNIQPDHSSRGTITAQLEVKDNAGVTHTDVLSGLIDTEYGKVYLGSSSQLIKKVHFGGHLSNTNNLRGLEFDRERIPNTWMISDGNRFNTGFTEEKIRDSKALLDMSITAETISEMGETLNQAEDSDMFRFLEQSLIKWTENESKPYGYERGFVEHFDFSLVPPTNVYMPVSQYSHDVKWYINRQLDRLKEKLNTEEIMYVIFANPANISLFSDSINWVMDKSTKLGGVQLDYSYGVYTGTGTRCHVVSSLKVPINVGFRIVAYPTTDNHITFKHYKYSTFITNQYRNPITPNILNIMGTSRYLTTEVLPVQGRMRLLNNEFGRMTGQIKKSDLPGFK